MDILSYILSKKYTDKAVSSIVNFKVHVVDSLPANGVANTFYLVSSTGASNSILYIWAENTGSFEQVGTTELTLGNYYTKDEVTALLNSIKVDLNNESFHRIANIRTGSYLNCINSIFMNFRNDTTPKECIIFNIENGSKTYFDNITLNNIKSIEYDQL